jgi:hypothetical protein
MSVQDVVRQVRQAGGTLKLDKGGLLLLADHELPSDLVALVRAHKPDISRALEIVTRACNGLPLSPDRFMSEMSAEDVADIEAGHIPLETLRAYAESISMRLHGRPSN